MSITTANGERYDSLENFLVNSPKEFVDMSPHIAMNDNRPSPITTVPEISGGLQKPPKPANDNDPRKPYGASAQGKKDWTGREIPDSIRGFLNEQDSYDYWTGPDPEKIPTVDWGVKGILPKVSGLENVEPSQNIVKRGADLPTSIKEIIDMDKESRYDKEVAAHPIIEGKETLGIGLKDVDKRIQEAEDRTNERIKEKLDHFRKVWKEIPVEKK